ncbi:CoA transferase [Brachybacterium hainanense]|uniref:CoA transferase n=1 Tax=Brachybacterium hainanense TaxID=1541174 RepID=A0ABV6RAU8_9MICO
MGATTDRLWDGPLDVDGLALGAVHEAARAVRALAAVRGADLDVAVPPEAVGRSFAAIDHLRIDGEPAQAWAPLSGFLPARDGWVRLHGNYPHHAAAIRTALGLGAAAGRDVVARVISRLPALETEERVIAAGGVAAAVRTPEQWRVHPQARAMADEHWVQVTAGAAAARPAQPLRRGPDGSRAATPLAGIRVLDLTRVIAGPTASQLLGCLGAEVLRIDPPHRPEILDQHLSTGMGKRSALLDLRVDAALLHEQLLPDADVVLLGYRPGTLDRFGLAPDALAAAHPGLVVGTLSAWGSRGPWGGHAGFDSIVQAATGIAVICGEDGRPGALPVQALDHATGFRLAAAVLDLLAAGRGGIIRASLLGAATDLLGRGGAGGAAPETAGTGAGLIELETPHGRVRAVPPPILIDGAQVSGPIGRYGASSPRWR